MAESSDAICMKALKKDSKLSNNFSKVRNNISMLHFTNSTYLISRSYVLENSPKLDSK